CLIYLGTCVAASGQGKAGKPCFRYEISGSSLTEKGEMLCGDMRLFRLGIGETAKIVIDPSRGFDVGGGAGARIEREVRGGMVGLILDARGRPLVLPEERGECRNAMTAWVQAFDLYPQ
ncbi:MAG: methylaspartate mutase, partial [Planctomycetaceae bacterium]|nr:methylaspartate mutase [Planctomycetaceae bacterium]